MKQEHREFTTQHVWRQTSSSGDVRDCVDMSSKCESVSVPNETVLGLSDTWTGQIKASEKFDYLPEASVTELWLVENKTVSFSEDYCNPTNDRVHTAFHKELDPDGIRGTLSGLRDESVQCHITNLSRNKTIEKAVLHKCQNWET